MRFLSTKIHGIIDYVFGLLLIAAPQIFHFDGKDKAASISLATGVVVIGYGLFTNYELSIFKGIPMAGHLLLDLLVGVFLITSPWLFGFADDVYLPQVVLGVFAIVASLITKTHSEVPQASAMM